MTQNVETLPFIGDQEHFFKKCSFIGWLLSSETMYGLYNGMSRVKIYRMVSISEDIFNPNYSCLITVQCIGFKLRKSRSLFQFPSGELLCQLKMKTETLILMICFGK